MLFFFLFRWILFWRCWFFLNLWFTFIFRSLINVFYLIRNGNFVVLNFLKLMAFLLLWLLFFLKFCWNYFFSPNIVLSLLFDVKIKVVITANWKPELSLLLDDLQFFLCDLPNHLIVWFCPFLFEGLYLRHE